MERIAGGVTAPEGYLAAGVACGLKKDGRPDLALLVSEYPAVAAGVFTTNQVKGHSLLLTQRRIDRPVRAVLVNSGNANACLGPRGDKDAEAAAAFAARALSLAEEEVLFASTGVIGQPLDLAALERGVFLARENLSPRGGGEAARAIMTTDTFPKEAAVRLRLGGRVIHIGGMAKGAGMIHPNLATLLGFLTTDAPVEREALATALRAAVETSFNAVTVDGDTSPCDMVIALANGAVGGAPIAAGTEDFSLFTAALTEVARELAKMVARDGEGATKLLTIIVRGARNEAEARRIGRAVGVSPLVKTAVFGADANWGRILSAVGNAGIPVAPAKVRIEIGGVLVCEEGRAVPFSEEEAKAALLRREVEIAIDLGLGQAEATVWSCDLTYDYIKINGSYRS